MFKHCDPAGLVFYPRYFEMLNDCVEAFFDELGAPFAEIHQTGAVPTARIEADFPAPSRLGDVLDFRLHVTDIGRTSAHLEITARAGDDIRLTAKSVLVHTGPEGRPRAWPDDLRQNLAHHLRSAQP